MVMEKIHLSQKLKQLIPSFQKTKILVIGDLMLDHFIWGKVTRISPEAPVPIVQVTQESEMPGGAANVAHNLKALGASTSVIGFLGKDISGKILHTLLKKEKINTDGVIHCTGMKTIQKTRIIAHHQQVVRFDRETPKNVSEKEEMELLRTIRRLIPAHQGVILEDYGKGVLTQKVVDTVIDLCLKQNIFCAFDPKMGHDLSFRGATLCTPNLEEARYLSKIFCKKLDPQSLPQSGDSLRKGLGLKYLLITLGEGGMALFAQNDKAVFIPTLAKTVFDVSGAGDTVISTFTTAILAGATPVEAAQLSNAAAGIVVGKLGTAVASPKEILEQLS
jgi:D-beta-D-heptose 7-phosphate kinase/D-beta-D-heptose 1-phosphate adenosyltransferase